MKPKHDEVRRILSLASICWTDFLNQLNSPLFSKSHLRDDSLFNEIYKENPLDEIREALILISIYWDRVTEIQLRIALLCVKLSKPHTVFEATLITGTSQDTCRKLVTNATHDIDGIEIPFLSRKIGNIDLDESDLHQDIISKYNREMMHLRNCDDSLVRAGIELQLIRRGFVL